MEGPASDLEFLLGASSFSDLTDRLEYVNVVASNDADLANEVQNTKNVLSAKEQNLETLAGRAAGGGREGPGEAAGDRGPPAPGHGEVQRDRVEEGGGREAGQEALGAAAGVGQRALLVQRLAARVRRDAVGMGGDAPGVPGRAAARVRRRLRRAALRGRLSPPRRRRHPGADGHADLRDVRRLRDREPERARRVWRSRCTARPATRTTRTCRPTPTIRPERCTRATSSGTSATTGDAQGGPPHDHFEFHPNSFPSGWPASYYGYTVIGSALNPYPLLVDACG